MKCNNGKTHGLTFYGSDVQTLVEKLIEVGGNALKLEKEAKERHQIWLVDNGHEPDDSWD